MSSTHQTHTRHNSEGDREFSFWGSSNTLSSENDRDQLGDNEERLNNETGFGKTFKRKNFKYEHSPFCSTLSDPSRGKAIAEGRRELMEMIQDMPESSYELSFQDMVVVEKQALEPEPDPNENTHMQASGNKGQLKKQNMKKKNKSNSGARQILRVESMDSETFLLKMFFPTSFDWMKKGRGKNGSKVSPRPSLQESIKQIGKEWRIKRFFLAEDNTGNAEDSISQHASGCSGDKNRYVDLSFSFSHGCWPFFPYAKNKTKK